MGAQQSIETIASRAPAQSILFDDWKARMQMACDVDDVMRLVRAYLANWTPEQLGHMPVLLASPALPDSETLVARAVIASRAELMFDGPKVAHALLREMALTLAVAASRLRYLRSLKDCF